MLDRAENVLNENPGEAIAVLDSIGDSGLSRSQRMRRLLLLTNAQNKCDTVFRSDSIHRLRRRRILFHNLRLLFYDRQPHPLKAADDIRLADTVVTVK
jgi:hypothetical protein